MNLYCSECGKNIMWIPPSRSLPEKLKAHCPHCNKVVDLTDAEPSTPPTYLHLRVEDYGKITVEITEIILTPNKLVIKTKNSEYKLTLSHLDYVKIDRKCDVAGKFLIKGIDSHIVRQLYKEENIVE